MFPCPLPITLTYFVNDLFDLPAPGEGKSSNVLIGLMLRGVGDPIMLTSVLNENLLYRFQRQNSWESFIPEHHQTSLVGDGENRLDSLRRGPHIRRFFMAGTW